VTPVDPAGVLQMLNGTEAGTDLRPALALLAGRELAIAPGELSPALRRSMLLLAAGGEPHRELELGGRAVRALADELDRPDRRESVNRGIEGLRGPASGLPRVAQALEKLRADPDLAWRAYACALLADELED
jgi:hypothetical protein